MFDEEEKAPPQGFQSLEGMSVTELEEYIMQLEGEIARVRQDIEKKKASSAAADAFFKG